MTQPSERNMREAEEIIDSAWSKFINTNIDVMGLRKLLRQLIEKRLQSREDEAAKLLNALYRIADREYPEVQEIARDAIAAYEQRIKS